MHTGDRRAKNIVHWRLKCLQVGHVRSMLCRETCGILSDRWSVHIVSYQVWVALRCGRLRRLSSMHCCLT